MGGDDKLNFFLWGLKHQILMKKLSLKGIAMDIISSKQEDQVILTCNQYFNTHTSPKFGSKDL